MTIQLPGPHPVPSQPMPSHPSRRDGSVPLPAPEERVRLRRAWCLTERQLAQAFGVTAATVRSWETGRTSPTGARRAAYAAFLSGLAHGSVPPAGDTGTDAPDARASRRARPCVPAPALRPLPVTGHRDRTAHQGPPVPPGRAATTEGTPVLPGRAPATEGVPVGAGPDPVAPARLRRFRLVCAAVGLWIAVEHLMATAPPTHLL